MVGCFYDCDGNTNGIEINQRIIGIGLDDLRKIPQVLAVARGNAKTASILGALRGRFLNVLTTDDVTARAVLNLDLAQTAQH
jgi:DNA-binding transcriptional regulator LsrR (DeoR family)